MESSAFFKGVEWLWALWLGSALALAITTIRTFSGIGWAEMRRFLRSEVGAAYSFAYVMTFPLYVLLIVIVIQTTTLLITHMGVVYSAYAGVRAAIVWKPVIDVKGKRADQKGTAPYTQAEKKIRQAVVAALAPFASSSEYHAQMMSVPTKSTEADDYYDTYIKYIGSDKVGGPVKKTYLTAKYRYAAGNYVTYIRTDVPQASGTDPWKQNVTVTVFYNAPFDLPVVARWLGKNAVGSKSSSFFVLPMSASASLQYEIPKSDARTLGIPDPFQPASP